MMSYKIVCDHDGETFIEGSVPTGTAFSLPPGWMNMNLYQGPEQEGQAPPPPIFMVLCPSCAKVVRRTAAQALHAHAHPHPH